MNKNTKLNSHYPKLYDIFFIFVHTSLNVKSLSTLLLWPIWSHLDIRMSFDIEVCCMNSITLSIRPMLHFKSHKYFPLPLVKYFQVLRFQASRVRALSCPLQLLKIIEIKYLWIFLPLFLGSEVLHNLVNIHRYLSVCHKIRVFWLIDPLSVVLILATIT